MKSDRKRAEALANMNLKAFYAKNRKIFSLANAL